jgi:DnaJ-class molecular chaperone
MSIKGKIGLNPNIVRQRCLRCHGRGKSCAHGDPICALGDGGACPECGGTGWVTYRRDDSGERALPVLRT